MEEKDIVLNINKPSGMTSCRVVEHIKRNFFPGYKVGHAGTLDPSATGVLLVCIGKATKRFEELTKKDKEYRGEMILGISTDTGDISGRVQKEIKPAGIKEEDVKIAFKKFTGEIEQIPPMYSALRYKGRRLYELAREGKVVERSPRKVHIYELEMLRYTDGEYLKVEFRATCSRGTYIRVLAESIGEELGCGACLSSLIRTRVGEFKLQDSTDLKKLLHRN